MNKLESSLKKNPIISAILISVLAFGVTHLLFGFYYEEYESLFIALLSGSLTPGLVYEEFPYMYMGGLAFIYGNLSSLFPDLPIINIISYLSIAFCLSVLIYVYIKTTRKEFLWGLLIIVILGIGYFELLNGTRRAVLYCLTSSVLFFYILKYNKPVFSFVGILSIALWIYGLFTRLETTVIFLSLSGSLFVLLWFYEMNCKIYLKYALLALFYVLSAIGFMFIVQHNLNQSDEFSLQIEPDCEYELSIKENFIPISEMHTRVDSLRYLAIKNNLWGDANLNNAEFLRSLIGKKTRGPLAWQGVDFYKEEFHEFIDDYKVYLFLYLLVFTYLLFQIGGRGQYLFIRLVLYSTIVLSVVFIVAVQLKSNHRVTVTLLGSGILLQWIVLNFYYPFSRLKFLSAVTFIAFPLLLLLYNYYEISHREEVRKEFNFKQFFYNKDFKQANTIYLTGKYTRKLLDAHSPLKTFSLLNNKNVFLIDDLALTTTEPYKTYVNEKLNCNVLDYSSFFKAMTQFDANALYLIDSDRLEFLRMYLKDVHQYDLGERHYFEF